MMYRFIILLSFLYIGCTSFSCESELEPYVVLCELDRDLNEISGMLPYEQGLLAFGDGGSPSSLFYIDSTCFIANEFRIDSVNNFDWEAITEDQEFIYLGDIGNNAGDRKDLHILKIEKSKLSENTPVHSTLYFRYEDQLEFGNDSLHNFDCEAIVVEGESIFLFTKNRGIHKTYVYEINTFEENQVAKRIQDIEIEYLVTGAFYDRNEGRVLLSSYDRFYGSWFNPRLYYFDFNPAAENPVSNIQHKSLHNTGQVESIAIIGDILLYASEAEKQGEATLYGRELSEFIN